MCPLCQSPSARMDDPTTRTLTFRCPVCGDFRITDGAIHALEQKGQLAFDIASWTYRQTRLGINPQITREIVDTFHTRSRPTAKERAALYLEAAIKMSPWRLRVPFNMVDRTLRVASGSFTDDDAVTLADYLAELGAIKLANNGQEALLTTKGHVMYDELSVLRASGKQAFVAMWFDNSMNDAFTNGIAPAIQGAGYEALRIDRKEHDQKIDDQIVAELRRSAFVVADFTEHRGGVYYEAGFAHGLNQHVLFTCRKDHLPKLHFDVRQFNTIDWTVPADIVTPLQNRILAVLGAGPLKPDAKPIPI